MINQNEKKRIVSQITKSSLPTKQKQKLISMVDQLNPEELKMVLEMQSKTPEQLNELARQQVEEAKKMHAEIKRTKEKTIQKAQSMITKKIIEIKQEDETKETEQELAKLKKELE